MIRNKTTLIVGAGASCELQMPSNDELLARIGHSFDFSRFGTDLQIKDSVLLAQYLQKITDQKGISDEEIHAASERIRIASKLSRSIDSLLDQHDSGELVTTAGKLAIVHFICQGEAGSILNRAPRAPKDLPLQGNDTWLFQLAQIVTSGVPMSQAEHCLDRLAIINFNYDRSVEHFLPHALMMAFGMELPEAQEIVADKLQIIHPYGTIGRLPWQHGEATECEWGTEQPPNIEKLSALIRTSTEASRDHALVMQLRGMLADAERIAFLGFGFQPQNMDLLIDQSFAHDPEVLATVYGLSERNRDSVIRSLKRRLGITNDDMLITVNAKCGGMMRDYGLLLES